MYYCMNVFSFRVCFDVKKTFFLRHRLPVKRRKRTTDKGKLNRSIAVPVLWFMFDWTEQ